MIKWINEPNLFQRFWSAPEELFYFVGSFKQLFKWLNKIISLPLRLLCVSAPLRWKIFNRRGAEAQRKKAS